MIGAVSVTLNALPTMDEAQPHRGHKVSPGGVPSEAESSFELVIRARSGDAAALNDLFERYRPRIQRWAHGRLPRAARGALDTHDLVQETLTKVFQKIHSFDPRHPGAFPSYVWTTLWNCIRDIARKYQRTGISEPLDDDIPAYLPSPLEEAMGRQTLERYERALERLRPEDREIILARIEMGLPYADIAAMFGKPTVAAAHMAVSRALVKLAEEMAHERKR